MKSNGGLQSKRTSGEANSFSPAQAKRAVVRQGLRIDLKPCKLYMQVAQLLRKLPLERERALIYH